MKKVKVINDGGQAIAGMTMRDWFAGQALTGAIAVGGLTEICKNVSAQKADMTIHGAAKVTNTLVARMMYEIADAMLLERDKKP